MFSQSDSVQAGELNFHSVYVGQGDALILESDGHYMIVDSGTTGGVSLLMDYLDQLDIADNKIDYVVSTHPDSDHVGGFPDIFEKYDVGQVIYSPCTRSSTCYQEFIAAVKAEGCSFRTAVEGETWTLGDATVEVIYNGSQGTTYNECSVVLRVTCDGKSILLTGDLPSTMERTLMSAGYNLKANIIKIGHHGAAASSCADFLDAVDANYAVISSKKGGKLPKASVLKRLARRFVKTYRTTDDDVVITIKDGVISTDNKENNGYTSIKNGIITLDSNTYYATGKKIKPSVTLTLNGTKISSGYYTVTYSSNKNAGTAKVKLKGTDTKYVGACSTTFTIKPAKETVTATLASRTKVKLTWSSQKNVNGFEIKYTTDKSFKEGVTYIKCSSSDKVNKTISGLSYSTTYYFKVRAYKDSIGNGKWSKKVSITTGDAPVPKKTKLDSLTITKKGALKITWKELSSKREAGYTLQYSTDKTFKEEKKTVTVTIKKASKIQTTIKGLKKGKTYYVRMRGYNSLGNGKWSKVKKIKISNN